MLTGYTAAATYAAEAPALAAGDALMARAAAGLADVLARHTPPTSRIAVLAGPGNNGADALYAAADLAERGYDVAAALTFDPEHATGAAVGAVHAAEDAGVLIGTGSDATGYAASAGTWVDGLAGIGLRPPARAPLAQLLTELTRLRADQPEPPVVFAVDLPSGVAADGGEVSGPVLAADHTVTFGAHKAAHLLPPTAHLCGRVHLIDIGIAEEFTRQDVAVHRVEGSDLAQWWPVPTSCDHKYTRGVVGLVTGSTAYPGAGVLSAGGALAAGPGMVRYLGQVPEMVLGAHPEVITQPGRVQAWVIGSGIPGRTNEARGVERALHEGMAAQVPIVVDAGGLDWVEVGHLAGTACTPRIVLTPHAGELAALLTRLGQPVDRSQVEADPRRWARAGSALTGASVVLKGAITVIVSGGQVFAQGEASPWLASAGTGDVLAGILGTVLAGWQARAEGGGEHTWPSLGHAIAGGVLVHGLAGARASGGGPITASDVVAHVANVIREQLAD